MKLTDLLARHGRIIGLGFALTLLSSFGQTFFISLSGPNIRDAFGLTNGTFGALYSTATLSSGLLMIWAGGIIDRVRLGLYVTVALAGLAAASLGLSLAPNLLTLGLSLFALRLFGQGMLSHAGVTSTARLSQSVRGRAVGIATLGFPAGEATLPALALAAITAFGWTSLWRIAAVAILLCLAAGWLMSLALRGRGEEAALAGASKAAGGGPSAVAILTDRRFLALVPAMIGYPAIVTAYLFHQRLIADAEGWPLELLASSLTLYALVSVGVAVLAGTLVDRFGAVRLSHVYLVGLTAASLSLSAMSGPYLAPVFFMLIGLSGGCTNVVIASTFAEMFGTEHLGRIRALGGAVMVVSSALGPGLIGFLLDAGITIDTIGLWFAAYLALASAVTFLLPNPRAGRGM